MREETQSLVRKAPACARAQAPLLQGSGPQCKVVHITQPLHKGRRDTHGAEIQPSHCSLRLTPWLRAVLQYLFLIHSKVLSSLAAVVLGAHLGSHFLPSPTIPSSQHLTCLLEPQSPCSFPYPLPIGRGPTPSFPGAICPTFPISKL